MSRIMKLLLWDGRVPLVMVLITTISCLSVRVMAESKPSPFQVSALAKTVTSACKDTIYPEVCESSLYAKADREDFPSTVEDLFYLSVQFAMDHAHSARALAYNFSLSNRRPSSMPFSGIDDCVEVLDDSLGQLAAVLDRKKSTSRDDIQTWLSASLTNQRTCLKSLGSYEFPMRKGMVDANSHNLTRFISNSLALHKSLKRGKPKVSGGGRRLLSGSGGFPTWVSTRDRKLLETPTHELKPHAVVAQDGSGTHKTIAEALASVSKVMAGGGRTVIHLTAGTYGENVKIPAKQTNVLLVGDGIGKTVIVGNRNQEDGWTTFQSATFAATGDGFMARDISFVNTAGPAKHQAVALRVGSDKSVFFRCSIAGYQDSLYTYTNRQFYRETDILGTVDFIFGNSAVVFQNCNIIAREPMSGQKNTVTAQGRTDPNQNTGISFHNCRISGPGTAPTFLGRPWQKYSRTVVMQSFLDGSIDPQGWLPWSKGSGFALSTLYYGEYMNTGPGSSTAARVNWPGYHPALTMAEANGFTVAQFVAGNLWLPSTGVAFDAGLHI